MRRSKDLTARQQEIYEFIRDKIRTRGYGPTVREIGKEFGINSPNGVISHLKAMQEKGAIVRRPGMSRAIELVKEGPASLPQVGTLTPGEPIAELEEPQRVDFGKLFGGKEIVLLQLTGMGKDQVAEGAYLVVEKRSTARSGQAVVATLPDGATTVGRFRRDKDLVRLEPIADKGKPVSAKKLKIFGVVLGVVRMF